ncbi:MAG: F0F1 ATP synthase subunit A [Nitrospirae bacterium]|nr:F0F1 ATP synthase subunit A [Nitrospirota bacterium]
MAILILMAVLVRSSIKLVPSGFQNFIETVVDALYNLCEETIGKHWAGTFFPLIGTLGIYILLCNYMGLIPGFDSPTSNINTTASCAIPVFLATHYYGVKVHGAKYINHFLGPVRSIFALPLMIMMFFIELIGHLVRPVTLSVRLFGNMMAKHILLAVLAILTPVGLPVLVLGLGVIVGLVQAFVFVLLSIMYLAGAVEEAH